MPRRLFLLALVLGFASLAAADEPPKEHGYPPLILIASRIDADGVLHVSGQEQRQRKITREIERDGKKVTAEGTLSYPVAILDQQTVSLKGVAIQDRDGNEMSIAQARERLKEPTPILIAVRGERIDPVYLKIMAKETLIFTFAGVPDLKPKDTPARRAAEEAKRKNAVAVGAKAPDFSVRTLDGKTVKLSELRQDAARTKSGVIVLTFWCSTCHSCRHVEHALDKLAKDYAGQAAVLALDANAGETAERVAAFAKEKGLSLPIVLDGAGRSADLFGVEVTTTTVILDGAGVVRYCGRFNHGDHAYAEDALKALLAGKEVAVKTTPHEG